MRQYDPGHERVALNAYECNQLELMERALAGDEPARLNMADGDWDVPRWSSAVAPWAVATVRIWLAVLGSAMGIVLILLAVALGLTSFLRQRFVTRE